MSTNAVLRMPQLKTTKSMTKVTQRHLWQVISISAFYYLSGGNVSPSCHPERRAKPVVEPVGRCVASGSTRERRILPPEILLDFVSHCFAVRLRLRSAQDDTGLISLCRRICLYLKQCLSRKKDRDCICFLYPFSCR